jgi:hypothetical protein
LLVTIYFPKEIAAEQASTTQKLMKAKLRQGNQVNGAGVDSNGGEEDILPMLL